MLAAATLRVVLGDQLTRSSAALVDLDPARDVVLMAEVMEEALYVPHHPKKLSFIFSAMRHFAAALEAEGVTVDYVTLDAPGNSHSLTGEVTAAAARHRPAGIVGLFPGEWRVAQAMASWQSATGLPVDIREDDRFLCSRTRFAGHAEGRRQLRMEFFYREMRRAHDLLLEPDGTPVGGRWNFDAENRKPMPQRLRPPPAFRVEPDGITREVIDLVRARFPRHFGTLDGFHFAVTAKDAEAALDHFIAYALPGFGDYQDAMRAGEDWLFHSVLSPYINVGLLDPLAVCRRAEAAYRQGDVPLNAAEGFIRQILGWREYVRGVYWHLMPGYAETNALGAVRNLPSFYWTGDTELNCVSEVVDQTRREAYAHHIQRLMVTGNFALIAGIDPAQVAEWYLAVYADAFEWVELPNVHGMALYADGGYLASKPYAAGGRYIDRMSNYCKACRFEPTETIGPNACPFNALYWDFLMRNRPQLRGNRRLSLPYAALDRMDDGHRQEIRLAAERFLDGLESWRN